ncbi:MAG: homoserine kinase [Deltaproteobacteria bacterium]|nr:homoserine kinase [Deltaproteobacteria bacterium]MBI3079562.1 homoserine kinase [Deltaproteobacteria bacterium]
MRRPLQPTRVSVRVPASTTNLGPGFDVLGMALGLYNSVTLEVTDGGLLIEVEGQGAEALPRDETNIVYGAAREAFDRIGFDPGGLRITLVNQIPLASGLGSSAAARVGGLVAANRLAGRKLTAQTLLDCALALEGHPDNAVPALVGGVTVACLVGGQVTYLRLPAPKALKAVVLVPEYRVLTAEARRVLPDKVPMADAVFNISRASMLVAALLSRRWELLREAMKDRLHQPYRKTLVPHMDEVFEAAYDAGARGVAMSGAGPSIVAFATEKTEAIGEAMKSCLARHGVGGQSLVLGIDEEGTREI